MGKMGSQAQDQEQGGFRCSDTLAASYGCTHTKRFKEYIKNPEYVPQWPPVPALLSPGRTFQGLHPVIGVGLALFP